MEEDDFSLTTMTRGGKCIAFNKPADTSNRLEPRNHGERRLCDIDTSSDVMHKIMERLPTRIIIISQVQVNFRMLSSRIVKKHK